MKKFCFVVLLALLPVWAFAVELDLFEVGDFTVKLPVGSAYDVEMSDPAVGMTAWSNPDKSCVFFYMPYQIEEGVTQEQRLISEATGMGIVIDAQQDQIVAMKLADGVYMSIVAVDQLAVGVADYDRANNRGMAFMVFAPQVPADDPLVLEILTSVRLK